MHTHNNEKVFSIITNLAKPIPEYLFVLLPMLILAIVDISNYRSITLLFSKSEWSFASTVLVGSGILKLVSGTAQAGQAKHVIVEIFISISIVMVLVPALVVLSLLVTSDQTKIPFVIVIMQGSLFIASTFVFFMFNFIGSYGVFFKNNHSIKNHKDECI